MEDTKEYYKKELERVVHNLVQTENYCKIIEKSILDYAERIKKIENLSKYAWEQVHRNPDEAIQLFKMIYKTSSNDEKVVEYGKINYAKTNGK